MSKRRFKNEKYSHLAEVEHQFKAQMESEDEAVITMYGEIGESWWSDSSTSAKDVERILKDLNANKIHVHINSGGGDVFDGIAIYNQLKNHDSKIIIHIDGLAASAASLIAMAGDEIIMNTGAMIMIHEAWTMAMGSKTDIQKTLNALEGIDKSIADIYMTKFKGEKSDIDELIKAETWLTADEAIVLGFANEIKVVEEEPDPEEVKNNVLQKFLSQNQQTSTVAASATKSILANFKRNSNE